MIYPMLDSKWVNLVNIVSKKASITVVESNDNELMPTHLRNSDEFELII